MIPPRPEFDAATHTYRVNGVVKKSVTQILAASGLFDMEFFKESGRDRGRRVHKGCALIDAKQLDWSTVEEEDIPRLQAYERFVLDTGFKASGFEQPLYSKLLDVCCTPDVWGELNGYGSVIERKTGAARELYERLQTVVQYQALRENFPELKLSKRFALYLSDDGYKLSAPMLNHTKDMHDFLAVKRYVELKEAA